MSNGRDRSEKAHHDSETTKREERVASSGATGSKPHGSNVEAMHEAGIPKDGHVHRAPEVDEISASKSLGIAESGARDRGESIPDSPYQKRG